MNKIDKILKKATSRVVIGNQDFESINVSKAVKELETYCKAREREVARNIRLDFIREFCNDHNGEIRWLRGISYDVNTLLDDILEYLQQQEKEDK